MLNRSDERRHLYLFLIIGKNVFDISLLTIMLDMYFLYANHHVEEVPIYF